VIAYLHRIPEPHELCLDQHSHGHSWLSGGIARKFAGGTILRTPTGAAPFCSLRLKQFTYGDAERPRNPDQIPQGRVSSRRLDAAQVRAMDVCLLGKALLGPTLLVSEIADADGEVPDDLGFSFLWLRSHYAARLPS
jgi:hypothetical protein